MDNLFADQQPDDRTEILNKWKDKSAEELLNAKIESDLYIRTLEKQKDELRQDYIRAQENAQASANLQDLIDRLNTQTPSQTPTPTPNENTAQYDPEEARKIARMEIAEAKLREQENANLSQVHNKLREKFGANTAALLREQANTLGLSDKDVNELAKKSPEAFFRMMGLQDQPRENNFMAPPRNDLRNDHFSPRQQKRDWAFYQDMKKNNPTQYWNPKTQVQMHKDAGMLGDAFETGDFNA